METSRILPPYGQGTAAPCTVANWVRIVLAPRSNNCCSWLSENQLFELGPHRIGAQIEQLLLAQPRAAQADLQHRHSRRAITQDQRRGCPRRKLAKLRLADGRDLCQRGRNGHRWPEKQFDDADSVVRLRLHMLDIVDRGGDAALGNRDNAIGHLLGWESVVVPDHAHHRYSYVRKDIGRGTQDHQRADQQNQQRQHHERIRTIESDSYNPHLGIPSHDECNGMPDVGGLYLIEKAGAVARISEAPTVYVSRIREISRRRRTELEFIDL